ncbi:MAG: lipopolysaccharide biosynthesis protein RfbH [Leptospirales bacterium]|nr:lipopolysaccharide biosynthesis protein RfbH [Leptospirales bacterium]
MSQERMALVVSIEQDEAQIVFACDPAQSLFNLNSEEFEGPFESLAFPVKISASVPVATTTRVGRLKRTALERFLRKFMESQTRNYYQAIHKPAQDSPFEPGKTRVTYAGRVFDAGEMVNLTNSALDFWLTSGPFSAEFEKRFAKLLGVRKSLLVNSGSSANLLAFFTLTSPKLEERAIERGDEIITVAAGFPTTVAPMLQYGAKPVFIDVSVDDGNYNADVSLLEAARSERTKGVMMAHTLGNPFDLNTVREFCKKYNLWLVEDNCDALGTRYEGQLTGSIGDLATSSFYPPHHLTMGEGGAVYTGNLKLASIAESMRDWGRDCWCASGKDNTCGKRFEWELGELPAGYDHKYIYSHLGFNLKVTDMQAAIGLAQLDKLDEFVTLRRKNWQTLRDGLADLQDVFILPTPTKGSEPSWFGFALTIRENSGVKRRELIDYLEAESIQTRLVFAGNLLRHPAFDKMRKTGTDYRVVGDLKNTDRVMNQTFWLGVYPGMKTGMIEYMIEKIRKFVRR